MVNKNIEYYLKLNYDVIVRKIFFEDTIIFKAFTNELDPMTFYGEGDTAREAIESFENIKEELFQYYLENNLDIAEPFDEEENLPSGKFIIRTTPLIHRNLLMMAKRNKSSLNQYINMILSSQNSVENILDKAESRLDEMVAKCEHQLQMQYGKFTGIDSIEKYRVQDTKREYSKVG